MQIALKPPFRVSERGFSYARGSFLRAGGRCAVGDSRPAYPDCERPTSPHCSGQWDRPPVAWHGISRICDNAGNRIGISRRKGETPRLSVKATGGLFMEEPHIGKDFQASKPADNLLGVSPRIMLGSSRREVQVSLMGEDANPPTTVPVRQPAPFAALPPSRRESTQSRPCMP